MDTGEWKQERMLLFYNVRTVLLLCVYNFVTFSYLFKVHLREKKKKQMEPFWFLRLWLVMSCPASVQKISLERVGYFSLTFFLLFPKTVKWNIHHTAFDSNYLSQAIPKWYQAPKSHRSFLLSHHVKYRPLKVCIWLFPCLNLHWQIY
jgi:hypothetical protein